MIDVVDRVPSQPGRYKMTLPDGSTQYVTLERADEPTVAGTPINKALFESIKEDLNKLNSNLKDYLVKKEITTDSVTIAANSGAQVNFSVPTLDGYTYITRVGKANGSSAVVVQPDSTWIYNTASSSATVTVTYTCIYIRSI